MQIQSLHSEVPGAPLQFLESRIYRLAICCDDQIGMLTSVRNKERSVPERRIEGKMQQLTNEVNLRRDQKQGLKRCFIAWFRGRKEKNTTAAKQAARKQRKQSFTAQLQISGARHDPLVFTQMLCAD